MNVSLAHAARLLALLLFVTAACAPAQGPPDGGATGALLEGSAPAAAEAPLGADGLLPASQLQLVYALVLQRYVDPVDHVALLDAAYRSLRTQLVQQGSLPLDSTIFDLTELSGDPGGDWAAFAQAYTSLIHKHADWTTEWRPDYRILRAFMDSLGDGHSTFVSAEEYRRRNETGYSGIGVRLSRAEEGRPPRVAEVFPGTPAETQGIRVGDRIVGADGQRLAGLPLDRVVDIIRGPEGSRVVLDIERGAGAERLQVTLTRRSVAIPLVEARAVGGYTYLRIRTFDDTVPGLVATRLESAGAAESPRGWVIDLRGNGGGRLTAVQAVAGMLVGERRIGVEVSRTREQTPIVATGQQMFGEGPLAVLIDSDTSSGAEILSAALREHRGAVLVGEVTGGNVAVAEEHVLGDGSAIQLTVRRFLSAGGEQIDSVGVRPDVAVTMTDADLEGGRDPQLERAVQELQRRAGSQT